MFKLKLRIYVKVLAKIENCLVLGILQNVMIIDNKLVVGKMKN